MLPDGTVTGEPHGAINGYAEWDPNTIVDTAVEYRIKVYLRGTEMDQFADTQGVNTATATLTPRRFQQFPRTPNKQYTYENRRATDNALVASGNVTADASGLIHVANFQITRDGNLLIVKAGGTTPANQPPKAVASASPASGMAPLTVHFTGSNSTDADGNIAAYLWNFGDGTSSALANPQHTYNTTGNYSATVTVTDNGGLTNTISPALTVAVSSSTPPNQPPVVNAGPDQTLTLPASAMLTATVSDDGQPTPPGALTLLWSTVSGPGPVTFTQAQAPTTTATFATAGTYVLRYTAHDGALAASDDVLITVGVAPPPGNQPPLEPAGPTTVLETRIAASADDADESGSSSVGLGDKQAGLRFLLPVPRGATIVQAYVQFTVYERGAEATTLLIEGEANDQVAPFTTKSWNITQRLRTLTEVPWAVPAWPTTGAAGLDQRTPDLAPILQEIIDRPGWASGQAIGLLFTGSGRRRVMAYDGNPAAAALLHVEYTLPPGPH